MSDIENQKIISSIAARTNNSIILSDAKGLILWVNEAFTRLTGYTLEEVKGKKPGSFLQGPESDPETIRQMRDAIRQGMGFRKELVNYNKEGVAYWVDIEVQPLLDDQGKITHYMAIGSDVTEKQRSQKRLDRINQVFLSFTIEPLDNMRRLLDLFKELTGCAFALYYFNNRQGQKNFLITDEIFRQDDRIAFSEYDWNAIVSNALGFKVMAVKDLLLRKDIQETLTAADAENVFLLSLMKKHGLPGVIAGFFPPAIDGCNQENIQIMEKIAAAMANEQRRKKSLDDTHRFASLVDNSRDIIFLTRADSSLTFLNRVAGMTFGIENAHETSGVSCLDFFEEESRVMYQEEVVKAVLKNGYWQGELKFKNKDNDTIDVQSTVFVTRNNNENHANGLAFVNRDITARKYNESLVQELLQLQSAILDGATYAIIATDESGVIRAFNKAAEEMLGYSADEIVGVSTLETLHDSNEVLQRAAEISGESGTLIEPGFGVFVHYVKQGYNEEREWTYIKKDGTKIPVLLSISALRDQNHEIKGFVGIAADLTQRKEAEAALKVSEERVRLGMESSQHGLWDWNIQTGEVFYDACWGRMLGFEPEEIVYTIEAWENIVHPFDMPFVKKIMEDHWAGKTPYYEAEFRARCKTGDYIWILARGQLVARDDEGKPLRMMGTNQDITRTKELQETLRLAKDHAEAATRSKSEFLANMSHEIRTPLNGVIGMTGLLANTPLSEQQHDFVSTIKSSSNILLSVINDILDFSKIEAGKIEMEDKPFDLYESVQEAVDLVSPGASKKSLELIYFIHADVPRWISGDEIRLKQVLVNILGNAIKFTPKGEVYLEVSCKNQTAGSPGAAARVQITFSVRDTGIGIQADKMQRLFKSFSQVDTTTTRQYGGTGLGLAISRKLVLMMGGDIRVESEPGKGSVFEFDINVSCDTQASRKVRSISILTNKMKGKKIFCVDDNPTNLMIFKLGLEHQGMIVSCFSSAREALEAFDQGEEYDIGVIDYLMPDIDGVGFSNALKTKDLKKKPPLLLASSFDSSQKAGDSDKENFSRIVTKPIHIHRLVNILNELLGGKNTTPDSRESLAEPQIPIGVQFPLKILLAEDNLTNQKVAKLIFHQMKYEVDIAVNGVEAVKKCMINDYDLVFMDVSMPEMDGLEATRRICKELQPSARPYIIALTANAMSEDRAKCIDAGMNDYLSKPVVATKISETISRYLDIRHSLFLPERAVELMEMAHDPSDSFLSDILSRVRPEIQKSVDKLNLAIESGDTLAIGQAAHAIKGNGLNVGLSRMSYFARLIESNPEADVTLLKSYFTSLCMALEMGMEKMKEYYAVKRVYFPDSFPPE